MISPDIFYVEDDQDFAFIMQYAVKEVKDDLVVRIVEDGTEAMRMLDSYVETQQKPKLILLDLNLPGLSGIDLLKKIKEIPYFKYVPVILFSTSDDPIDVKRSLEFGANAYLTKPDGYTNLITCIQSLYDFWFNQNRSIN
ncbi:response regulator [Pedobacter duraquae]|uniref:Response regulator receiver domain-containing protein n=1 Tax=Pedobacter duraquae TaxID=425511 RepID=A0A4R6IP86_9SPHI|nr:response regulator [Pedobacter duraquae]TDO24082.1 response regulator receiver domain-containing protein [Pedobacter duraquae]